MNAMVATLTGQFETRREAEMAVERLIQEYEIDRADILIIAAGDANSAGEELSGSGTKAGEPSTEERSDAAFNGAIEVSVEVADDSQVETIRAAFAEFNTEDVEYV